MGAASSADAEAADLAPGETTTNSISGHDSDTEYVDAHSSADEIIAPSPPLSAAVPRVAEAEGAILAVNLD